MGRPDIGPDGGGGGGGDPVPAAAVPALDSSEAQPAAAVAYPASASESSSLSAAAERRLRLKIDLRLCTIAGVLCALNLADSSIISSASVTSIFQDLDLGVGNRYSVAIFIFTVCMAGKTLGRLQD